MNNKVVLVVATLAKPVINMLYSPPTSIEMMEKIFSLVVFGETLPKPTLVRLLIMK